MNLFNHQLIFNMTMKFSLNIIILLFILLFFISTNSVVYSQENMPDFPYDPEEKATQKKICAKICLKRRDACLKIESDNPQSEQMCQSQMIVCINQCR
jgi:hypothetical protein